MASICFSKDCTNKTCLLVKGLSYVTSKEEALVVAASGGCSKWIDK